MKKYIAFLLTFAMVLMVGSTAFAYSYDEVFKNAPPQIINWGCPTATWYSVSSKWNQPRDIGTNPHQGIDIAAPYGTTLKCVWSGWTTKIGTYSIRQKIDINNDGIQNDAEYNCDYYHLSSRSADGYYAKGSTIGATGNEGGAYAAHLHFGGVDNSYRWFRNETNYRWTTNWNGGKAADSYSNVQWNSPSCQITVYFNTTSGLPESPGEVRIFHRQHGTTTWTDGGLMTNAGSYNYTYNFSGKYASGTSINWLVRIKRSGLSVYSYCFAPSMYVQPDPNPNAPANAYPYYQNTLY